MSGGKVMFEPEIEIVLFDTQDIVTTSVIDLDDPNNYTKVEFWLF